MLKSVRRLMKWVSGYRKRVYAGYVFSFFYSIFVMLPLVGAAYGLNLILEDYNGTSKLEPKWIWIMLGFMIFAVLGRFLFSYLRALYQDSVAFERTAEERIKIGDILKRVSLGFFAKNSTGEISTAVTTDLSYFEMYAMKMLDTVVNGYIGMAVMAIYMLFFSPPIALVTIIGIALSTLSLYGMSRTSKKNTIVHQKVQDDMVSAVLEYVRGISIVKAFGRDSEAQKSISRTFEDHKKINIRIEKYFAVFNALHLLSLKFASVGVVLVSVILKLNGTMSMSIFIMMCIFSFVLFTQSESINNATHVMKMLDSAMDKVEGVKNASFIDADGKEANLQGYDIEFEDVSFSYEGSKGAGDKPKEIISNVSFKIPQGETTAIIGPSGSGKTTLTRLIARFYDVDSGRVLIGGKDVKGMNCDSLLSNISMVFQQVYLFNDTIENNIRFGKENATHQEVIEAAKAACCHDFILALPDGYQALVGDAGSTLSGGEKQRISIARAMLKNAPIVILDEATASVDPENEQLIQKAISTLISGKTIVVIAHRLKTIQDADQIVVMENGRVADRGTHQELIVKEGIYKNFWLIRKTAENWTL